jgi:hypothetical protein
MVHEAYGHVIVPAGTLDDDPGVRPIAHFFTSSKAPWYEISDSAARFDQFPPQEWFAAATKSVAPQTEQS